MNKIVLSLAIVALVSAVAVGASVAYFTDTEVSSGNTFSAGTLELTTNSAVSIPFSVSAAAPGGFGTGDITLGNSGSINGEIQFAKATITTNQDNGCNTPEGVVDSTCSNPGVGQGELQDYLVLVLWDDVNNDDIYDAGTETLFFQDELRDLDTTGNYSPSALIPLNASASKTLKVRWDVDPAHAAGNLIQSDSVTFDLEFTLKQI